MYQRVVFQLSTLLPNHLQETIENPDECVSNNILGTVNVIDLYKKINLVFASTCAVYSFKSKKKFKEKDACNVLTLILLQR